MVFIGVCAVLMEPPLREGGEGFTTLRACWGQTDLPLCYTSFCHLGLRLAEIKKVFSDWCPELPRRVGFSCVLPSSPQDRWLADQPRARTQREPRGCTDT